MDDFFLGMLAVAVELTPAAFGAAVLWAARKYGINHIGIAVVVGGAAAWGLVHLFGWR